MKKLCFILFVLIGFTINSFAQATASAGTTATIVATIGIANVDDLEFGNVAVTTTAGTVVLAPNDARTPTGGVTLPATTGVFNAAEFTVTGAANFTYAITLPSSDHTITRTGFAETMIVNAFTSTPSGTGDLGAGGSQTLTVGATLNVSANQVSGLYEDATNFDVTVNYN